MNDYMRALRQRFFKEPELKDLRREIESTYLSLKAGMDKENREKMLEMIDLESELQDEISLASFKSGFQLALGIVSELCTYSFAEDEERRAFEEKDPLL